MNFILALVTLSGIIDLVYSKHLIVVGKDDWESHDSGDKPEECAIDTSTTGEGSNSYGNNIGVQCCNIDGSSSYRKGFNGGSDNCLEGVDYDTAKNACESNGDRLCSADEVRNNVGAGSGCNHDARHVWTADPCGAHWVSTGANGGSVGCRDDDDDSSSSIGVQCCHVVTKTVKIAGFSFKIPTVEGYRQGLPGGDSDGCLTNVDFATAEAACDSTGGRLCTFEEIGDNVGQGEGCSHDSRRVWSSDVCGDNGLDYFLAETYAPYLRFDSQATDGFNGFPSAYNHPDGKQSNQNRDSSISGIPTYYRVFHDELGRPESIMYHWYYEFQTACIYDGVAGLNNMPSILETAITNVLDDWDFVDPGDFGEHDNDNERIYINLKDDYSLKSVTYHQHSGAYTVTSSSNKIDMYDTTHPTVYVGRVAHGSYHNKVTSIGGCGYYHDYRDGNIKRKSWDNLHEDTFYHWIDINGQRDDGWESNTFCDDTGCNWEDCETASEINSNPDQCTPLDCSNWSTGCLPWGTSDTVQAFANIKDKYFWLFNDEHPDCSCVSTIFGNVCAGENIKGEVCTPAFSEIYPIPPIPDNKIPVEHHHQYEYKDVTFTISATHLLLICLIIILLLLNCVKTTIYDKCRKYKRNDIIKYKSVKIDSESEVEEEFIS